MLGDLCVHRELACCIAVFGSCAALWAMDITSNQLVVSSCAISLAWYLGVNQELTKDRKLVQSRPGCPCM